ncbi:putative sulfate exporter family transporter [Pontibacter qinzhouensis]|uniref:Putative sulfate exporter family transporter n=1 Tax=Pontibacter qinzhouensis TaxID=2603253 RepID=A0A5C8K9P4_9BACT|nr:putative sulfate exporter family transporter [Pontibacter qinzhouensis]TXK45833.1 putative sulfate exporter family transporter [Pontibacter qinzhouensis]
MGITSKRLTHLGVFWLVLLLIVVTEFISAPIALFTGILLGLTFGNPYPAKLGKVTKYSLQASVVGLGFGINLYQVAETGLKGFLYTGLSLIVTIVVGLLLAKLLGVGKKLNHLISAGTAICGGSAIAAVAPAIKASEKEISVALGVVFILNAMALFIFPFIGNQLQLSQEQFGIWAAIAIHDTSSVVGAATHFGEKALEIATTLKLTRALWILPIVLITGFLFKSEGKASFPKFILFFLVASLFSTFLSGLSDAYSWLTMLARKGLIISLFLTGAGISLPLLRTISIKPFMQGVALWLIIASGSLLAVYYVV